MTVYMTPQQRHVARQVDAFWRGRGYVPAIKPAGRLVGTDPSERLIHALEPKGPRRAICDWKKSGLIEATDLELLHSICRRCVTTYIYRFHGIKVRWHAELPRTT